MHHSRPAWRGDQRSSATGTVSSSTTSRASSHVSFILEYLRRTRSCPSNGRVSISSTGDYATGAAFPIGKAFLRPFQKLRKYKQRNFVGFKGQGRMFFNPTAHLTEFHSHFIGRVEDPKIQDALRQCHEYLRWRVLGGEYSVVEKPGAPNRTPYWVMSMPPSIVPDHGTIFTPVFRNLLVGFLEAARLYGN